MIFETTIGFLSAIIGFLVCDILYKKSYDVSIFNKPEKPIVPSEAKELITPITPTAPEPIKPTETTTETLPIKEEANFS
jgi:hypothetical protein